MDSGCDLFENVEYIHKCGGYAIGTMYINSFAEKENGVEIIKREYEKQLVIEAADSGIDEILILGLDVSRDNISDVLIFLSDIKKESLDTKIGISISYQDLLEDKNGEYLASMLLMVVDFIALDSKSVPCVENETLGEMKDVLQTGVGHLGGTKLPIGDDSSHSVLAAHRGLPSARLFTDIDQMKKGDMFTISPFVLLFISCLSWL